MATCPTCRKRFDDTESTCPDDGDALLPDAAFASADTQLEAGTQVGEYVVEQLIGDGSYGEVYGAEHPVIGKRAAIKVLHRKFSSEPEVVSRFIQEARAVNKIRHRNIIDIFSFGQLDDGRQYLIMELLVGETLQDMLSERGPIDLQSAYPILRGVADALDAAHAEGIAHRDLKPENIFVSHERDGKLMAKLLDFGIAKLLGEEESQHKTKTGQAVGTPLYMAPEQCRGRKVDHRADLYSFGVVIYQLLTGEVPFDGESAIDVLYKHISEVALPMSEVLATLPQHLDVPVSELMAKNPSDRPESAGAALSALMSAEGIPLDPDESASLSIARVAKAAPADESGDADTPPSTDAAAPARTGSATAGTLDALERNNGLPTKGSSAPWLAGMAAAVVLIGGAIWLTQSPSETAAAPATTAQATAEPAATPTEGEPEPAATPTAPTEALSTTVELRLDTSPSDVEVWLGDKRIGSTADVLALDRGDGELELTLKKVGFRQQKVRVTPHADIRQEAKLKPITKSRLPARRPPTAQPAPKPAGADILDERD